MPFRPRPVHILDGPVNSDGMAACYTLCGVWNPRKWTDDPDKVTCQKCHRLSMSA